MKKCEREELEISIKERLIEAIKRSNMTDENFKEILGESGRYITATFRMECDGTFSLYF